MTSSAAMTVRRIDVWYPLAITVGFRADGFDTVSPRSTGIESVG
jgi:hypothetical protein